MKPYFHSEACKLPLLGLLHFQDFSYQQQDRLGTLSKRLSSYPVQWPPGPRAAKA